MAVIFTYFIEVNLLLSLNLNYHSLMNSIMYIE